MTAQATDSIVWQGDTFRIAGLAGRRPFELANHRLTPTGYSTANYRGYWCGFDVPAKHLVLSKLHVYAQTQPPDVDGVAAVKSTLLRTLWTYELKLPLAFSGGLVIVGDLLGPRPVVPFPWRYERVFELVFDGGELLREVDHSGTVAEIRERIVPIGSGTTEDERSAIYDANNRLGWSFVTGYTQQPETFYREPDDSEAGAPEN